MDQKSPYGDGFCHLSVPRFANNARHLPASPCTHNPEAINVPYFRMFASTAAALAICAVTLPMAQDSMAQTPLDQLSTNAYNADSVANPCGAGSSYNPNSGGSSWSHAAPGLRH